MIQAMINYMKVGKNDELYTPKYAITPLLKYIPKNMTIWCPFDTEDSNYVKVFKENGYNIINSHIDDGRNFFNYEPDHYDIIVSNPPFSVKDQVLERCFNLGKPFMLLLPLTTLEGINRGNLFRKYGIDLIIFDRRVQFFRPEVNKKNVWFNTSYFTWEILHKQLIFEHLETSNKKEVMKKES